MFQSELKTALRRVFYRHRNTEFIRDMVRQNRRIERASCVQRLSRRLPLRDLKQMTCGDTRITFAATNKAMKKALTAPSAPVKVTAWLTKAPRTLRQEQTLSQSPETPSPWGLSTASARMADPIFGKARCVNSKWESVLCASKRTPGALVRHSVVA